ncbi:hypothetical protein E4U41_000948 [Claviceps citrina]|nr:hypothetical protein E4U41_000948 [Claviceps citrina]
MAAIIGDLVPDLSRFHDMIVSPSSRHSQRQQQQQQQHRLQSKHSQHSQHSSPPPLRPSSRLRAPAALPPSRPDGVVGPKGGRRHSPGSAEFPSPPPSSSPPPPGAEDAEGASMASQTGAVASANNVGRQQQQPSPPSSQTQTFHYLPDSSLAPSPPSHVGCLSSPSSTQPQTSQAASSHQQTVVHVRDLAHMQKLADAKMLGARRHSASLADSASQIKYEISGMPIADVIEMVAALLTKITTTNDLQHDAMQRNAAHQQQANQPNDAASSMSPLSHSVLTFHGKNVPAITILSYLSRIHKYCPTTYEVFLSLLVYFDRMTERVNDMVMRSEQAGARVASQSQPTMSPNASQKDTAMHDDAHASDESNSDLADDDNNDDDDDMIASPTSSAERDAKSGVMPTTDDQSEAPNPATYFVVDSFNIHRLIISGVTCASKFFSDVFYTNSRYAKVGGLPLAELNHLEIQFLVLNDFRLAVPVEDLEAYATMLVEFYAREVMAPRSPSSLTDA